MLRNSLMHLSLLLNNNDIQRCFGSTELHQLSIEQKETIIIMLNMSDLNESIRANCTARYLLNESSIDPISIFDRHPQCELQRKFMPNFLYVVRTFMLAWLITGLFERYWCVRGVTIIPGICQIFQCLFIFTQYYSIVLVFGFTLERYLAVCFPFKRHKLCTTQRAILAVIILALFIIGPMLSQAVLWTFEKGECRMRINIAMDNRFQTLLFVQEVLFSLVIPLATLIFNILVLCEMRRLIKSSNY
ncbi:unnamed protein product [Heterobilharzia americana]|nr:unnamed protein product [Heterobilharzia americana]